MKPPFLAFATGAAAVLPILLSTSVQSRSAADGPAYSCAHVAAGSVEELICKDPELSALDRKLAGVYASAAKQAAGEQASTLKAGQ